MKHVPIPTWNPRPFNNANRNFMNKAPTNSFNMNNNRNATGYTATWNNSSTFNVAPVTPVHNNHNDTEYTAIWNTPPAVKPVHNLTSTRLNQVPMDLDVARAKPLENGNGNFQRSENGIVRESQRKEESDLQQNRKATAPTDVIEATSATVKLMTRKTILERLRQSGQTVEKEETESNLEKKSERKPVTLEENGKVELSKSVESTPKSQLSPESSLSDKTSGVMERIRKFRLANLTKSSSPEKSDNEQEKEVAIIEQKVSKTIKLNIVKAFAFIDSLITLFRIHLDEKHDNPAARGSSIC